MLRLLAAVLVAAAVLAAAPDARAQAAFAPAPGVRGAPGTFGAGLVLNVGVQTAFPARTRAYDWTEAFGLTVDLPILRSFYLSPQTTIYRLSRDGDRSFGGADLMLNFKFVIPLGRVSIDLAPRAGVTTGYIAGKTLSPHFGVQAGFRVDIVANFGMGLHATYGWIINDSAAGNLQQLTMLAAFVFKL